MPEYNEYQTQTEFDFMHESDDYEADPNAEQEDSTVSDGDSMPLDEQFVDTDQSRTFD